MKTKLGTLRRVEGTKLAVHPNDDTLFRWHRQGKGSPLLAEPLEEGSFLTKGRIVDLPHPVVERVMAAGAVVHICSTDPAARSDHDGLPMLTM